MTIAIGFLTAFPLLLAMMFSMDSDLEAALNSQLPMMEIFYEITKSRPLTQVIMTWVAIVLYCRSQAPMVFECILSRYLTTFTAALLGQWVTCGRLAWAFARDVRISLLLGAHSC